MAEEQIAELIKLVEDCTNLSVDSLVSNANWGTITFESARADLDRVFTILNAIKIMPLQFLPDDVVNQATDATKRLKSAIEKIKSFTIEQENPANARTEIIRQLREHLNALTKGVAIWIPYLAYQRGDIQKNIDELNRSVSAARKLYDDGQLEVQTKANEISGIIAAAREASASAGVAHFTQDFFNEHTAFEKSAKYWLITTAALAIVTLLVAILFVTVWTLSPDAKTAQIVQTTTSKFVVFALLFGATFWCGALYKAAKHQSSLNKHRSNALKTFRAFVQATDDDGTRDAVLLETTKSIFALAPSGYLKDGGQSEGGIKVIELLRGGLKTGPSS